MRRMLALLTSLAMSAAVAQPALADPGGESAPAPAAAGASVPGAAGASVPGAAGASDDAAAPATGSIPAAEDDSGPRVGDDAPAFSLRAYNEDVALKLVKSPLVSLNNFVGLAPEYPRKVVLVGFFALWNEKSRKDLATFQKIYKKYKDDGVVVLMVSIDNKEMQTLYEAIEKDKVTYPVLRDRFGVVSRRYGVTKLPSLYIMDKDDKISSIGEGYQDDVEGYVEQEIKRILKE